MLGLASRAIAGLPMTQRERVAAPISLNVAIGGSLLI
jgi:hypothetical protein